MSDTCRNDTKTKVKKNVKTGVKKSNNSKKVKYDLEELYRKPDYNDNLDYPTYGYDDF